MVVQLPKLSTKAWARLLEAVAPIDVAPALQTAIIERADGNPFFLEELVRARTTADASVELPEMILAMLQTRLDQLGDEPKRLMQAASIFGQSFRLVGLEALLGDDPLQPSAAPSHSPAAAGRRPGRTFAAGIRYDYVRHAIVINRHGT